VDAPSPKHGAKAYVPARPNAKVERHWPPASRESAIERARRDRLELGGLAVDAATLERVADAVMHADYPLPGLFLTTEECRDYVPEAVLEVVHDYLHGRPEIDGGLRLGYLEGRCTLFVGIAGDPEPHKAQLSRIGGDRLAFESVPRTMSELDAISERIFADEPEIGAAGFELLETSPDPQHGVVRVELVGHDAAEAQHYFAGRYGDAVAVEWCGPSRDREVPHPFGSWTSDGRTIRVFYGLDFNREQRGQARVTEESVERIVIALTCLEDVGPTTLVGGFQRGYADLELREPVGNRAVIDASAGAPRPSLAQLRRP
jgi:hypothetical protein